MFYEFGPIAFVPECDNPNIYTVIRNPNDLLLPQHITFAELHEGLYYESYMSLFRQLKRDKRLPLGKLSRYPIYETYIDHIEFKMIRLVRTSEKSFDFYPVIKVYFSFYNSSKFLTEWYTVPGRYDSDEGYYFFQDIQVYNSQEVPKSNMNDYLLPFISNYEDEAHAMLAKHQKKALKYPCQIDAESLAEAMGFKIRYVRLSSDKKIQGKVVFYDAEIKIYNNDGSYYEEEVKGGTILIDLEACAERGSSGLDAKIHECIHIYEHRLFIELQREYYDLIKMCNDFSFEDLIENGMPDDCLKLMERHTSRLTPRVMMPKVTTERKIRSILSRYNHSNQFLKMEHTVKAVAEIYDSSWEMAKNRMVELGYHEAQGVLNFVDGKYTLGYTSDKKIEYNKSYTIPLDKLMAEMKRNKAFNSLIESGKFIYIDGHVCLRDPKYIWKVGGKLILSPEARAHINKCCLLFTIRHEERDYEFIPGIINKETDFSDTVYCHTDDFYANLAHEISDSRKETRLVPDGFYAAFMYYKAKYGYTFSFVALETMIEESRVKRLLPKNEEDAVVPTYHEVVAVAVIICPTAELALDFIEKSGYSTDRTAEQQYIRSLIFLLIGSGIEEFNHAMICGGYDALTGPESKKNKNRGVMKNVCCD